MVIGALVLGDLATIDQVQDHHNSLMARDEVQVEATRRHRPAGEVCGATARAAPREKLGVGSWGQPTPLVRAFPHSEARQRLVLALFLEKAYRPSYESWSSDCEDWKLMEIYGK